MKKRTRRNVLGSLSAGLGLVTIPGFASAQKKAATGDNNGYKYELKDGELVLTENESSSVSTQDRRSPRAPADAVTVPDGLLKKTVREMNELNTQGHLEFTQEGDEVLVTPTDKLRSEYDVSTGEISTADHGDTDYTRDLNWWGINHFFALDDDDTSKAIEIALYGAGASAAAGFICSVTGVGTVATAAFSLLAGLLGASAGLMGNANNGHGIVIKVHQVYSGQGWVQFDGQFENDNGWPL